jgi:hypothetical protein
VSIEEPEYFKQPFVTSPRVDIVTRKANDHEFSRFPIEKAADQVIATLSEKERFNIQENRKPVQMCAAARTIKAGLFIDPSLLVTTLNVEYNGEYCAPQSRAQSPGAQAH